MPYLSIDIASYDDKRHCRLKLFIVIAIIIIIITTDRGWVIKEALQKSIFTLFASFIFIY